MQKQMLQRYFDAIIRLRHFLQAQESVEDALKKVPAPRRFLWVLPLASFGAAFFITVLQPLAKRMRKKLHGTDQFRLF